MMKQLLLIFFVFCHVTLSAQQRTANEFNQQGLAHKLYDAVFVEKPPLFAFGADSVKRFYFDHFNGYDSVLLKCISKGDTAKYIRIYFSFTVDKEGLCYDIQFDRVAATRYAKSELAKTLKYFIGLEKYFNTHLQKMIREMPLWKPALQYQQPVDCKMHDYFQFWVSINSPAY